MAVLVVAQTIHYQGPCVLWLCMEASRSPVPQFHCDSRDHRSGVLVDLAKHREFSTAWTPEMGDDGDCTGVPTAAIHS